MPFRLRTFAAVVAIHLLLAVWIGGGLHFATRTAPPPDRVIDVVDTRELLPPPPVTNKTPPPPPEILTPPQEVPPPLPIDEPLETAAPDSVMPVAVPTPLPPAPAPPPSEPVYLAQSRIGEIPLIPAKAILARIQYPDLAAKMGLEATVFLELFIDQTGVIRKVSVLKDPGNGFAQAAVQALEGMQCQPAKDTDGNSVAVRFRYPVRFTLR